MTKALNNNPFADEAYEQTQFFCRRCGSQPNNAPIDNFKNDTETIVWANRMATLAIEQKWLFDKETENVFCASCAPHIDT